MTFDTCVAEMLERLPELGLHWHELTGTQAAEQTASIALGSMLVPALEQAAEASDLATMLKVLAFLEDAAAASESDGRLKAVLQIEVGEWLNGYAVAGKLDPWLGKALREVTGYVPGLGAEREAERNRPRRWWEQLLGR